MSSKVEQAQQLLKLMSGPELEVIIASATEQRNTKQDCRAESGAVANVPIFSRRCLENQAPNTMFWQRKIKAREQEDTPISTTSGLLKLPRELRDIIFEYAAFIHFRDIGVAQTPGLLRANKQLRSEFEKIVYNPKLLQFRYYHGSQQWKKLDSASLLQAMLQSRGEEAVDFAGRFLGFCSDRAERMQTQPWVRLRAGLQNETGVLELAGTDGRCCITVAVPRSLLMKTDAIEAYRRQRDEYFLSRGTLRP